MLFAPGSRWQYSNTGYLMLGALIERVTGQTYFAYMAEHVFTPSGMRETGFYALDEVVPNLAVGYARANHYNPAANSWTPNTYLTTVKGSPAGGLYSTARDLLAFTNALTEGRLLPRSWTDSLFRPMVSYGPAKKYGYGIAEEIVRGQRVLFHDGGAGGISTELDLVPEHRLAVIVLSNYDPPAGPRIARAALRMLIPVLRRPVD